MNDFDDSIRKAAQLLRNAHQSIAFTGAGISVESGIPPFRGATGLWSRYDPIVLDIGYFFEYPKEAWSVIKEIFYDFFGQARPNAAHQALASLEKSGHVDAVITQNIDNLHQQAGSVKVHEYHGTSQQLLCSSCSAKTPASRVDLTELPPKCEQCGGLLRPDFVFFGEPIPQQASDFSMQAARTADLFLVIGTTGEIMPASMIPRLAKENGAKIVEINPEPSNYTYGVTDVFIQEKATTAMTALLQAVQNEGGRV